MSEHRHPRCITPPDGVVPADPHIDCKRIVNELLDKLDRANVQREADAARIAELERQVTALMCWGAIPFACGELDEERANAFSAHLASCAECKRTVEANAQLDARLHELAAARLDSGRR